MIKKVAITLNPTKKNIVEKVNSVIRWLQERGVEVLIPDQADIDTFFNELVVPVEKIKKEAELIISLGGDGTLFRSAREFSPAGIPIFGINVGGLGFLTEVPIDEFKKGLEKILVNNYSVEQRLMLEARIICKKQKVRKFIALNDVVISKSSLPRIVSLRTFVSGKFVTTYSADGLIISTPTGSTAYSLSAGGPVVYPDLKVIILSPICAHTLAVRPLIVSQEEKIKIIPEPPAKEILLTIDGQEGYPVKEGEEIEIRKSPYSAKLIRLNDRSFFKILRAKLGWSGVVYRGGEK